ncbi:PLP-dependent aminotransferase family protein [Caldalkalibacillus mannanilyticus]|uniref:MocR-like pyridoxine biosynthesis transcription factor PdxR n=1 Tax=Caldalkalibacillus mannanilyticus TaxID=1418 RepID=UPI0005544990|nr:PLP-dependent aminotransferase family protein [Caldalkalibacillus mannanilyticus]
MIEFTPALEHDAEKPLYFQIYDYIKEHIITGQVMVGTRLPSIRSLSDHLKVSRNTIESAYQQLISEGYVESKPRSGLYVVEVDQDVLDPHSPSPVLSVRKKQAPAQSKIDFRYGNVDQKHFPMKIWRKCVQQRMSLESQELFGYGDPQGEYELRQQIASYLLYSRGVVCTAEQVIIGSGIQHLLSLFTHLVEHKKIAVENPGYDVVPKIFKGHGYHVIPIPVDDHGIEVAQIEQSETRMVYVTPSHQFPQGVVMPISRRLELLKWAEKSKGLIIEDDYDSEFRYVGKPIPALQGLDKNNRVVYFGSFSKSFLPSLRMGYMVVPESFVHRYLNQYLIFDNPVPSVLQLALAQFMKEGHWMRHIRRMRRVYLRKHHLLLSAITQYFGEKVQVIGQNAGLHILLEVYNGMEETSLIESASKKGVRVYPISRHFYDLVPRKHSYVQIGFGGVEEDEIGEGIRRLYDAWFK